MMDRRDDHRGRKVLEHRLGAARLFYTVDDRGRQRWHLGFPCGCTADEVLPNQFVLATCAEHEQKAP